MEYVLSIFIGTFVLEDLALASSIALMAENKMSLTAAFLACFLGISLGDVALYILGFWATRLKLEKRFHAVRKLRGTLSQMKYSGTLTYSILISRMIPGTRVPTYLAAGFLKYPFWKFVVLTILSVSAWVLFALLAGESLNYLLMNHWLLSLILFFVLLQFVKSFVPRFIDKWQRRALWHGWRKWMHFEFWPAWLFYAPVIPYYIFLSLKYRSALIPFYVNPHLRNGGLIGESKWDFIKHLDPQDSRTLAAFLMPVGTDFLSAREMLEANHFTYPFILKPDVGQRGYGVRIIRDDFDLTEYLLLADFDLVAQRLSALSLEAGLFYVRHPLKSKGQIFSITDKKFPVVLGDGARPLGRLILNDSRARIIAPTYFARFKGRLDEVPESGKKVALSECGNHCQGAIFLNGERLRTEALLKSVEQVVGSLPDFYFGRLDVRYADEQSLMGGHFEIVEINGAGSEATHIWDAKTSLIEAYKTLFQQWNMLFAIGFEMKKNHSNHHIGLVDFLKECRKVVFRKEALSISS